ncbi:MAG: ribulose-phosphate 3-epimerase [Actinobacteria bacterium RBG_13_63_9]|nr:MAG: ribulose-phosphate 3-epimerase [Actinobacteria bacterium RBG_13_63_9]
MAIPTEVRRQVHLAPSILSADFSMLGQEVATVMDAGMRIIHVDVMDGHYVPNITVGPLVVEALASLVHGREGFFSVHLMIERPENYIQAFVRAGADAISVHVEACTHAYHAIRAIQDLGASAGLALNPGSDAARVTELAEVVDFVLVMTVNPGFGGQKLLAPALEKVVELRRALPADVAIEVDGGINRDNIRQVVEKGANWVVTGSAIFGADDPGAAAQTLRALMVQDGAVW